MHKFVIASLICLPACAGGEFSSAPVEMTGGVTGFSAAGGEPAVGGNAGQSTGGSAGQSTGGSAGQSTGGSAGQSTGAVGGSEPVGGSAGQATGGSAGQDVGGSAGVPVGGAGGTVAVECIVDTDCVNPTHGCDEGVCVCNPDLCDDHCDTGVSHEGACLQDGTGTLACFDENNRRCWDLPDDIELCNGNTACSDPTQSCMGTGAFGTRLPVCLCNANKCNEMCGDGGGACTLSALEGSTCTCY